MAKFRRNPALDINTSAATVRATFQGLDQEAKAVVGSLSRWQAALRGVNDELQALGRQISRTQAQMTPEALTKRVGLQLQLEQSQRQLTFAESRERAHQLGPGRALADVFNIPDVSKKMAGLGGKIAGLGDALGGATGGLLQKAGGALGGAAAGPIGVAVGAILALTPAIKGLAAAPFNAVVGGFGVVNKALAGLTGTLGPVGSALGLIGGAGGALKSFGDKLGPLGIGLSVAGSFIEGMAKQVEAFLNTAVALAAKASPGTTKRLQFAVDDAAAVVGHRLVPVIELLTSAVRLMGDVMTTILPSTDSFRSALAPIGEVLAEVRTAIAPLAHLFRVVLVEGLREAALGVRVLWEQIRPLIQLAGTMVPNLGRGGLESSQGAAFRNVSFQSSEQYARSVYAATASSQGVDPSQRTAQNTAVLPQILEVLQRMAGQRGGLGGAGGGGGITDLIPGFGIGNRLGQAAARFLLGH